MKKNNTGKSTLPTGRYLKYAIGEIVLVVIGILFALSINNWNEIRKNKKIEQKIVNEISNGLSQDLIDIELNIEGHLSGLKACEYWRKIITNQQVDVDSVEYYYHYLTRDFISVQNISGYESLKSKGLELVSDDSLRIKIIQLYEQDYSAIRKLEEEYQETQFSDSYFKELNHHISPNLIFDKNNDLASINLPFNLTEKEQKNMLSYFWKIKRNRQFILKIYLQVKQNISDLQANIDKGIESD